MKKKKLNALLLSAILSSSMSFNLVFSGFNILAEENSEQSTEDSEQEGLGTPNQKEPIIVQTGDQLLKAVQTANDGDTIVLENSGQPYTLSADSNSTSIIPVNKSIILEGSENPELQLGFTFAPGSDGSVLSGVSFTQTVLNLGDSPERYDNILVQANNITIKDCSFSQTEPGTESGRNQAIVVVYDEDGLTVSNCKFTGYYHTIIYLNNGDNGVTISGNEVSNVTNNNGVTTRFVTVYGWAADGNGACSVDITDNKVSDSVIVIVTDENNQINSVVKVTDNVFTNTDVSIWPANDELGTILNPDNNLNLNNNYWDETELEQIVSSNSQDVSLGEDIQPSSFYTQLNEDGTIDRNSLLVGNISIEATVNSEEYGSINIAYNGEDEVVFEVNANIGYSLNSLAVTYVNSEEQIISIPISPEEININGGTYTFSIAQLPPEVNLITITGSFSVNSYTCVIDKSDGLNVEIESGTMVSPEYIPYNALVIVTVEVEDGYDFNPETGIVISGMGADINVNWEETEDGNYVFKFNMPASTVSITASAQPHKYTITTSPSENGTVNCPVSASFGETVNITADPEEGYFLESVSIQDSDENLIPVTYLEPNQFYFEMPLSNVSVTAQFSKLDQTARYNITLSDNSNIGGTTKINPETATSGTMITITLSPNQYFTVGGITASYSINNVKVPIELTPEEDSTFTFIMPPANVSVDVIYEQEIDTYPIKTIITPEDSGSVRLSNSVGTANNFAAEEEIKITALPASGYKLGGITGSYVDSSGTPQKLEISNNSFVMPAGEVTLTIEFIDDGLSELTTVSEYGKVSYNPSQSEGLDIAGVYLPGTQVTGTITPNPGYEVLSVTLSTAGNVTLVKFSENTFTITIPETDAVLTVTYSPIVYVAEIENPLNGNVLFSNNGATVNAAFGSLVSFTVIPDPGYVTQSLTVQTSDGTLINYSPSMMLGKSSYTFTMPSNDVTISATFRLAQVYSISYSETEFGSVQGPITASEGERIELTLEPDADYIIDSVMVTSASGIIEVNLNTTNNSAWFYMPASNVTVEVTYIPDPDVVYYSITVETSENGTITCPINSAKAGTTITLSAVAESGYKLGYIVVYGNDSKVITLTTSPYRFIMPSSNVTIEGYFVNANQSIVTFMNGNSVYQEPVTIDNNTSITLPDAPTNSPEGFVFVGWRCSLNNEVYSAGKSYTVNGNVTFYAVWEEVEVETYTVTLVSFNGRVISVDEVEEGETFTLPNAPTVVGYTFDYWLSDEEEYEVGDEFEVTSDMLFLAIYTSDSASGDENTPGVNNGVEGKGPGFGIVGSQYVKNDNGTVTTYTMNFNGSKVATTQDANGNITDVAVTIPADAIQYGSVFVSLGTGPNGRQLTLPGNVTNPATAPVISIDLPVGQSNVTVKTLLTNGTLTPGTVAGTYSNGVFTPIQKSCSAGNNIFNIPLTGDADIVIIDNSKSFTDVPNNMWYTNSIDFISARNIMQGASGAGSSYFDPEGTLTRAMLAEMIWNLEGQPTVAVTQSVDDWYEMSMNYVISKGWMGVDSPFDASSPVKRQDLAVILWRMAGEQSANLNVLNGYDYSDRVQISSYATEAVAWCVDHNIIGDHSAIMPQKFATRAEIAKMFMNYILTQYGQ